jgi:hypothetical protein
VAGGRGTARGREDTLPHKKINGDSWGTCGSADQLREETRANLLALCLFYTYSLGILVLMSMIFLVPKHGGEILL